MNANVAASLSDADSRAGFREDESQPRSQATEREKGINPLTELVRDLRPVKHEKVMKNALFKFLRNCCPSLKSFMTFSSVQPHTTNIYYAMTFPARSFRLCTALLFSATAGALLAQKAANLVTFRVGAQMVLVPVTVTDHNGKTIEGLRAENFSILDNRKPQQILSFGSEDAPCSVVVVLDISGSMRPILASAKDIVRAFFGTANTDDEFLLLTVSSQPAALPRFTADTAALESIVDFARPGGMTALIDTVYLGLSRMREARRPRRALLVLSDGMDNYSRYSQGELMRVALEADTQIYTIILENPSGSVPGASVPFRPSLAAKPIDQARQRQGPASLDQISEKTGGLHFHVRDGAQAKEAAIKVGQALRNEYLIGYQPPDSGTAGKWHRVRVGANLPKVNVYARAGYYSH